MLVTEVIAMATQPVDPQLRKTGIGVVGDVPWGTHFFMFYETKEDLLDTLVPYFKAGLETGELCLWLVSEPLSEEEARNALRDAVPEFDRYQTDRSIEIVGGRRFYFSGDDPDLERVMRTWAEKTDSALARGYAGFRLSASTAWLERKDWKAFSDYEHEVNNSISRWRMTALCTYPLAGSTAAEILDVTRTHQFAIARRNRGWEVVETSDLKQAKSEIKRLNDELEQRVMDRTRQLAAVNEQMRKEMVERQRAEEALQQAQADLARVTRALDMGELVATIAHEVNQPLTAIVTNANFCLRRLEGVTPSLNEFQAAIREIVNDGTRASAVISRIRGLLMKGAPKRTEVDINRIIQDVNILLRNELTRNRVSLRTDLAANLPRVAGDEIQLQQVLINLIINALEAMRLSTEQPRKLLIRSAESTDSVLVQVQDSGPGIEPGLADRIFEPFFTTKAENIGMGLSISHSIIESHGGHLSIVPVSQGASLQFTLPASTMPHD
jgi:C4-dicarboxylate-specific signal transduction histidine kinase